MAPWETRPSTRSTRSKSRASRSPSPKPKPQGGRKRKQKQVEDGEGSESDFHPSDDESKPAAKKARKTAVARKAASHKRFVEDVEPASNLSPPKKKVKLAEEAPPAKQPPAPRKPRAPRAAKAAEAVPEAVPEAEPESEPTKPQLDKPVPVIESDLLAEYLEYHAEDFAHLENFDIPEELKENKEPEEEVDEDQNGEDAFTTEQLPETVGKKPRSKKQTTAKNQKLPKNSRKSNSKYIKLQYQNGLNLDLPPLLNTQDFVEELAKNLVENHAFRNIGRPLRVATACSGTEAPILFLERLQEALRARGVNFLFEHVFSIEIVPYKQQYIRRNFDGVPIFRDICEANKWTDETRGTLNTAYGGRQQIPTDVDLFIAGTACVDFSNLNKTQSQQLEQIGESADTFKAFVAILGFLKCFLAILENVVGAPWIKTKALNGITMMSSLEEINYSVIHHKLDTKDYGIPQTRQRGYMLAVNNQVVPDSEMDVKLNQFIQNVLNAKRPASSPVEQWLRKSDCPKLLAEHEGQSNLSRAPINWCTCERNHKAYRSELNLGDGRPVTQRTNLGKANCPIHFRRGMKGMVDRILDYFDIAHLRGAQRGYDDMYQCRLYDVSQNIHIHHDNIKAGLSACLTPLGSVFITTRGAKASGSETLLLQGLDLDRLTLHGISQAELKNFAGNAMSITVVGTFISMALVSFGPYLPQGNDSDTVEVPFVDVTMVHNEDLILSTQGDVSSEEMSVIECKDLGMYGVKFCYCEGRETLADRKIYKCSKCKQTACAKCVKNPQHHYEPFAVGGARVDPSMVQSELIHRLPMTISIASLFNSYGSLQEATAYLEALGEENEVDPIWKKLIPTMAKALTSVVHHKENRRSFWIETTWSSESARLCLDVSPDHLEWHLYAVPDRNINANDDIRVTLEKFPIARMVPAEDGKFFQGSWQLWLPKVRKINAIVYPLDTTTVPSWLHEIGLVKHQKEHNFKYLGVIPQDVDDENLCYFDDIFGEYALMPECGQAKRSMHVKIDDGNRPTFLFHDVEGGNGDWVKHPYVFTKDCRRLDAGAVRLSFGKLLADDWEQPVVLHDELNPEPYDYDNQTYEFLDHVAAKILGESTIITSDGNWVTAPQKANVSPFGRAISQTQVLQLDHSAVDTFVDLNCHEYVAAFQCDTLSTAKPMYWPSEQWTLLSQRNIARFTDSCLHALLKGLRQEEFLEDLDRWVQGKALFQKCYSCAPLKPGIQWGVKVVSGNLKQVPVENREEADEYESTVKGRLTPFRAVVRFTDSEFRGLIKMSFKLGINPQLLMDSAAAMLEREDYSNISTAWRLVTDDSKTIPTKPIDLTFKNTIGQLVSDKPKDMKCELDEDQLRTFSWLNNRDEVPATFVEEEVEEARFTELGYRLEGRARHAMSVSGGLLASEVGYGKTAISLALIANQRKNDRDWAAEPDSNPKVKLQATLILVPSHIILQWRTEISKFLKYGPNDPRILVIRQTPQLRRLTIGELKQAHIVLVASTLLTSDSYLKLFADTASMVALGTKPTSRMQAIWRGEANEQLHDNLRYYNQGSGDNDDYVKHCTDVYNKRADDARSVKAYVPSKRTTGAAYKKKRKAEMDAEELQSAEAMENAAKTENAEEANDDEEPEDDEDPESAGDPAKAKPKKKKAGWIAPKFKAGQLQGFVLESFRWKRFLVDEISYMDDLIDAMTKIEARSRFALSATPKLTNFDEVKMLAKFLGIRLGVDTPEKIRQSAELSDSEVFLSYRQEYSNLWHHRRHELAQQFIDMFVREDRTQKVLPFKVSHFVEMIHLNNEMKVEYQALMMPLVGQRFDLRIQIKSDLQAFFANLCFKKADGKTLDGRSLLLLACTLFSHHYHRVTPRNGKQYIQNWEIQACGAISRFTYNYRWVRYLLQKQQVLAAAPGCVREFSEWNDIIHRENFLEDPEALRTIRNLVDRLDQSAVDNTFRFYRIDPNRGKADYPRRFVEHVLGKLPNGNPDHRKLIPRDGDLEFKNGVWQHPYSAHRIEALDNIHKEADRLSYIFQHSRFARTALDIKDEKLFGCDVCNLEIDGDDGEVLFGGCGHVLCKDCGDSCGLRCIVPGCFGMNEPFQKFPVSMYVPDADYPTKQSDKFTHLVELLKTFSDKTRILVFSQYPDVLTAAQNAVKEAKITCDNLLNKQVSADVLQDFQAGEVTVLFLNIGDETAAGSNLTVASVAIFLTPFYALKPSQIQSSMFQAVGRVVRRGQRNNVRIYHFLTARTVEVDWFDTQMPPDHPVRTLRNEELIEANLSGHAQVFLNRDDD